MVKKLNILRIEYIKRDNIFYNFPILLHIHEIKTLGPSWYPLGEKGVGVGRVNGNMPKIKRIKNVGHYKGRVDLVMK